MNIERVIAKRYAPPEWAVVYELADGVASRRTGRGGRIDAAAFSCWPSKGLMRIAFEIKRTRQDFKKEVKDPKKSEWVEKNFHQTYLVVPAGLVKSDEVPESWGLLEVTSDESSLVERKVAMRRDVDPLPEALALSVIRSLGARLHENITRDWWFEEEKLTQEMLEKRVCELTASRENHLTDLSRRLGERKILLDDERSKLWGPLKRLALHAGLEKYWRVGEEGMDVVSVNDIEKWVEMVRGKQALKVVDSLKNAHDVLEKLLNQARNSIGETEGSKEMP